MPNFLGKPLKINPSHHSDLIHSALELGCIKWVSEVRFFFLVFQYSVAVCSHTAACFAPEVAALVGCYTGAQYIYL